MQLEDILIEEKSNIRTAIERLEKVRCKVIYVMNNGKLVASISDGDVRRYALQDGNVNLPVKYISNYNPTFLIRYEKEKLDEMFGASEVYSIPIVNYNHEVVEVIFRNGRRIRRKQALDCPVVMMAGGKGTRLYPYTQILPKALIPVGELPISERIINSFLDFGCEQFYLIVNHKKNMIHAYFDNLPKAYDLHYIEEDRPLGTGGGLYLLDGEIQREFFLVNCDIIIDADYSEIYNYHRKENNFITIVAAKYRHVVPYGVVSCDERNDYTEIHEKPQLDYLINTGMYIVSEKLLKIMPHNTEIAFPDLIDSFKQDGKKIGVYVVEESAYMDMGQLEELEKMKKKLNL
ncbi:MAG: sugar phosphate nucleotidyltransferase [Clostridium sp.]|nr:sugar phosphate nucleotidyltransferase [Clostridium sp.]